MRRIGFLGLGAMGARMATRLIAAGFDVTVWNRTGAATAPLEALGARAAPTPAAAAEGADLVIAMVRDDDASRAVWLGADGALGALGPAAIALDCSTLSLPHVDELAAAFAAAERRFLDAPLAGSRPQAEAGQLIFFCGGDVATLEAARPALEAMGGAVHHAGAVGAGAAAKLMVNGLFGAQLALLGELIGFAGRAGVDPERMIEILCATPVASPAAKAAAPAMLADQFPPAFPIDLVAKDFALLTRSGEAAGAALPMSRAVGEIFEAAKAEGYAADNITGIVQRYR